MYCVHIYATILCTISMQRETGFSLSCSRVFTAVRLALSVAWNISNRTVGCRHFVSIFIRYDKQAFDTKSCIIYNPTLHVEENSSVMILDFFEIMLISSKIMCRSATKINHLISVECMWNVLVVDWVKMKHKSTQILISEL